MKSVIINRRTRDIGIPGRLMELLPYRIADAIRAKEDDFIGVCEEIRLRVGKTSVLGALGRGAVPLDLIVTREEMDELVERLCGGSLYAHSDTIKNGYISIFGGIRAGVCGHAAIDGGKIIGISEISSLCIRIPHEIKVDTKPILSLLRKLSYSSGVLIYSPPGEGKTTLLRSIAFEASRLTEDGKSLRVAVVDSRGELEFGLNGKNCAADVLSGYPKGIGIEIALRTLNASVIVCDEIGNEDEARSIIDAANGGAALVASTHASDIRSLMSKKSIRLLHEHGVFGAYVGIKRQAGEYIYTVTMKDEVM